MTREVTDEEGARWSCAEAFAGLAEDAGHADAARVKGTDRVRVVCTPSGGARSVHLELPQDWREAVSDDDLLAAIREAGARG